MVINQLVVSCMCIVHLFHLLSARPFQFNLQIEQGIPVLSKWIIFNRFKFVATKGIKLGPTLLLTRLVISDISNNSIFLFYCN